MELKKLRSERKLTQKEVADALKISFQSYSHYENGRREPDIETLKKMAEFFNVTTDFILGRKIKKLYDGKAVRIKVYSSIPAGIPAASIADVPTDEWEEISERAGLSAEHIGIRVKGDSMNPNIIHGDILIVRIQPDVENGETAIVRINGEEWTVKKVKKTNEGIMLLPTNPAYEPLFYNKQQIEQLPVQIVGKVTEIRRTI